MYFTPRDVRDHAGRGAVTDRTDDSIQAQILELLKEMRVKYNLTIILITHDLASWPTSPTVWPSCMPATSWRSAPRMRSTTTPATPTPGRCCPVCPRWGVKGEDLFNIQGTPPNLFTEIHGDAFAPRNPLALKIDFVKRPPYFDVSTTHRAKTWLLDPRAPKIEPPAAVRMLQEEGK